MENISTIAKKAISSTKNGSDGSRLSQDDIELVNWIFEQLTGTKPAWRHALSSKEAVVRTKRAWTAAIIKAGITKFEQIQHGITLAGLDTSPFLPSVGQFIDWCKSYQPPEEPVTMIGKIPSTRESALEQIAVLKNACKGRLD